VYEAALRGDPRMAIITPDRLTAARHVRLGKLGFALAMAPPETMLDTDQVNAGVYRDVIEEARTVADLVIVDTQIVEAVDTSELIDDVVIPALAKDAWALAISDVSMASVDNLKSRLTAFAEAGVPPDRVMFTVNRMSPGAVFNPEALADVFRHATTRVPLAHYVGAVAHDQAIADGMNIGGIEHNLPSIAPMLDTVLFPGDRAGGVRSRPECPAEKGASRAVLPAAGTPVNSWLERALCAHTDPTPFITPTRYEEAKQVCALCPVITECREWAITTHEPRYVWGGLTPTERRAARSQRARQIRAQAGAEDQSAGRASAGRSASG